MKKIKILLVLFTLLFSSFAMFPLKAETINTKSDISSDNDLMTVLCNVLNFVRGGVGKTVAAFIIIGVGLGFFTGKVSWGVLIGVTLGISAMFGAPAIISAVTGGDTEMCKS